jgi:uncharacterized protein YhdP
VELGASTLDVDVALTTSGPEVWEAEIDAAAPRLTLQRAGRTLAVRVRQVEAHVRAEGPALRVDVDTLRLDNPALDVAGYLALDRAAPRANLAVQSDAITIETLRELATFFAGADAVRTTFETVRGGRLTRVAVRGEAASVAALARGEGLTVQARLDGGHLHFAREQLDLESAAGTVSLRGGRVPAVDVSAFATDIRRAGMTRAVRVEGERALWRTGELDVQQLRLRDSGSDATATLRWKGRAVELELRGALAKSTLEAVSPDPRFAADVTADLQARILLDDPARSTAQGRLTATDVRVPGPGAAPLRIVRATLDAAANGVQVDAAIDAGNAEPALVRGTVRPSPEAFVVDLDLTADRLIIPSASASASGSGLTPAAARAPALPSLPLRGSLRAQANALTYGRFTWEPFHAVMEFTPDGPTLTVRDSRLCKIDTPGTATLRPGGTRLAFEARITGGDVAHATECLLQRRGMATGSFTLTGTVAATGQGFASADGTFALQARNGRLLDVPVLAKSLAVLGLAGGSIRSFADFAEKGIGYNTVQLRADLQKGRLIAREAVVEGPSVKLFATGTIDLTTRTQDLTLMVVPLKGLDDAVRRVPLLGDVLGGATPMLPVRISGRLDDPTVTPLDLSAVDRGFLGLVRRSLSAPLDALQPLLPPRKR